GLATGLQRDRVWIFERSPVLSLKRHGLGWKAKTPKGSITAAKIILANNGHLESFGFAKGRLMHLFLFAVMTPNLPADALGGQPRWGVTPSDPMGTTVRRIGPDQGGHRIITRTCAALRPGMRAARGDMARAAKVMQRKFDARFPALAGMTMEYAWAGHLCLTRNGSSVVGPVEDQVFSACVQNGLGTTRGTLAGMAAAELALDQISDITDFFTQQSPPKRLPPPPFQQWGGNTVVRWKEWTARQE
ncbi:MAG: FAD-binding oxidoreductase, partial [Pseudomonadota bacterium]